MLGSSDYLNALNVINLRQRNYSFTIILSVIELDLKKGAKSYPLYFYMKKMPCLYEIRPSVCYPQQLSIETFGWVADAPRTCAHVCVRTCAARNLQSIGQNSLLKKNQYGHHRQ